MINWLQAHYLDLGQAGLAFMGFFSYNRRMLKVKSPKEDMNALPTQDLDGLPLEYKLYYGCARGNANLSDVIDDPNAFGPGGILCNSLEEELARFIGIELSPVLKEEL